MGLNQQPIIINNRIWVVMVMATRSEDGQDFIKQTVVVAPDGEEATELAGAFLNESFPLEEYGNRRVTNVDYVPDDVIKLTGVYNHLLGTLKGVGVILEQIVDSIKGQPVGPGTIKH